MENLILTLLGIGKESAQYTFARANIVYHRLVRILIALLTLILVGFALNYFVGPAGMYLNILLSIVFTIAAAIVWARPIHVEIAVGLGVIAEALKEETEISRGISAFLKHYAKLLGFILAGGSFTLFFLGIVPLEESPKSFFVIIAAITVVLIAKSMWGIGGNLGKRFIYYSAFGMIVLSVLVLIPRHAWIKFTGYDVKAVFAISETDAIVSKVEELLAKNDEEADKTRVANILDVVRNGNNPSYADMKFLEEVKKKRDKNSLTRKLSNISFSFKTRPKQKARLDIKEYSFTPRWNSQPGPNGEKTRPGEKFLGAFSPGTYTLMATGGADTHWIKSGGKHSVVRAAGILHYPSVMAECHFPDKKYGEMIIRIGKNRFLFLGEEITIRKTSNFYAFSNKRKSDPKDYTIFSSNIKIKIIKKRRS